MGGRAFFAFDLAVNFLVPWLLYRASRPYVDETHAIMISAAAPMVWGIVQFARSRKLDTFSLISLGGIALSLAIFALGGSPKVLLVRESLIAGAIGLVFIVSALIGRPLALDLIRGIAGSVPAGEAGLAAKVRAELDSYAGTAWFRRLMFTMTLAFGFFCIAEMAIRVALAFTLPTERFLLVAPIARYAVAGVFIAWTFFYFVPSFRRQDAEN